MQKYPTEIFGYPSDVRSSNANKARKSHLCPFVNKHCNKKSRLINYPMGVCSVRYGEQTVAICPRRFLQDNIVFKNIANHYFGGENDLLLFSEIGLSGVGTFDFVIVKHKTLSNEVEDFIIIEFQTNQTTGTGALVQALEDYISGNIKSSKNYGFGLNTYDTLKRSFTQILTKGIVLEKWGHKIYWVFQEPVYRNFVSRYNLQNLGYANKHNTVFSIYDMELGQKEYTLKPKEIESSTIDNLFFAFRNNPNIPDKDAFVERLGRKILANIGLNLRTK